MNEEPVIVKGENGYHLSYPVCEIEEEKIIIGYDGENLIVGAKEMTQDEYEDYTEITDEQQERLDIPDKKMAFFRSQLPSITHLNNVFQSKKDELE
jgi:hypothetical protein